MKITKTLTLRLLLFALTSSVLLSCEKESIEDTSADVETKTSIMIGDVSSPLSYDPNFRYFKDGNEITDKEDIILHYETTVAVNTDLDKKVVTFLDEKEIANTQARFSYKNVIVVMSGESTHPNGKTGTHHTYHTNSSYQHDQGRWIHHTKRPQSQNNPSNWLPHFDGDHLNKMTVINPYNGSIKFGLKYINGVWHYWTIQARTTESFGLTGSWWLAHRHYI